MISSEIFLSAAGASFATITLGLAASRLSIARRSPTTLTLELVLKWMRLPARRAALVIGMLATVSGLCFAQIADDASSKGAPSGRDIAQPMVGAVNDDAPLMDDRREQAIEKLRQYVNGIEERRQALAGLSSSPPSAEGTGAAPLPDVETMIARLAKRLESDKGNVEGWRMLGWSYLRTDKFAQAASAYETALSLDPQNEAIKTALAEAREKVQATAVPSGTDIKASPDSPAAPSTGAPGQDITGNPMIRDMVDRLAKRLEDTPRDADGWLRLMRARTVLGESEQAHEALRRALSTFADDKPTRDRIEADAKELGLSAY